MIWKLLGFWEILKILDYKMHCLLIFLGNENCNKAYFRNITNYNVKIIDLSFKFAKF